MSQMSLGSGSRPRLEAKSQKICKMTKTEFPHYSCGLCNTDKNDKYNDMKVQSE